MAREKDLLKKIRDGDNGAREELIGLYYEDILRYCFWNVPRRDMAEDAAQETFLKVVRYFAGHTDVQDFRAFLYKVAKHTCLDLCRKKNLSELSLEDMDKKAGYLESGFERTEQTEQIKSLLGGLSEELREVALLRYAQDLSLREIAGITDYPLRTVQSRLRRALRRMRENGR